MEKEQWSSPSGDTHTNYWLSVTDTNDKFKEVAAWREAESVEAWLDSLLYQAIDDEHNCYFDAHPDA